MPNSELVEVLSSVLGQMEAEEFDPVPSNIR
jgi:hypothetical protein